MGVIFRHVGIVVSCLDQAIDVYTNLFKFELKARFNSVSGQNVDSLVGLDNAVYDAAIIRLPDDNRLELIQYQSHIGKKREPVVSNDIGCSHFAISVDDIDSVYEDSSKFPIKFVNPPYFDGAVKVAYAIVMDECLIEIVEVVDEKARFSGGI